MLRNRDVTSVVTTRRALTHLVDSNDVFIPFESAIMFSTFHPFERMPFRLSIFCPFFLFCFLCRRRLFFPHLFHPYPSPSRFSHPYPSPSRFSHPYPSPS
eukprot:Selendium_serpulae@DN6048_c0_g1_i3.p1